MKIKRIKWWNYRGLSDGEIYADGADVEIRGQNGVGKSSIASIVPFVLFNDGAKNIRSFDDKGSNVLDDGKNHGAEVEFDDGTVFRRECGHNNSRFVNGELMTEQKYKTEVSIVIGKGAQLTINPFEFLKTTRDWKDDDRRRFLVSIFGAFDESKIFALPEFAEAEKIFNGESVDIFENRAKGESKRLKSQLSGITTRIDENYRKLEDIPIDPKVRTDLETELAALKVEREKISSETSTTPDELKAVQLERERLLAQDKLPQRIQNLQDDKNRYSRELSTVDIEIDNLVAEYKKVSNRQANVCPTCNQPISKEKFDAWKSSELERIIANGKMKRTTENNLKGKLLACDEELDALKKQRAEIEPKLAELDERIKILSERIAAEKNQRGEILFGLNEKITALVKEIQTLDGAAEIQRRISELRANEKILNQQLSDLERQLTVAKKFQVKKMELLQEQINANFEHVQFKMFDYVKTTGELKPTCEAMLHGVPYSALSKGEKLKAALDIFRTLQKIYEIEMPLLLDDAESYTRNSFVDLPNQLWLFKVSDEPTLIIEIKTGARLAA